MFYRAKTGDIQQQNRIIDAVAQLKVNGTVPQTLLDRILADNPPLLRVKIKEEIKPGSMKFRGKTFDVVKTALVVAQSHPKRGGKSVLKQILPYIDFDYYKREREKILHVLKD